MIYFTNASGGITLSVPDRVYQGSPEGSKVYLVGPYAENAAVTAKFFLPDGRVSEPCLLERECDVEGYTDADGNALAGWAAQLPACVTEKFGIVRVQFEITAAGGAVSAAAAHFTVERGTPPQLPVQPQADVYAQILAALAGVQGDLSNGYFAARSLYQWNALYEYGAGELVYFAEEGESGAFVRSVAAGNKGNPPYANGVLDAAHWEEAVPFDAVLEAEQNAAASAAAAALSAAAAQGAESAAAESEQAAETSKTAAAQSASDAAAARQNAQTYAQNANSSAVSAAASAELARQYAEIGIQPNTDYTALDDLPVPGTTKFIYLLPSSGSGDNDTYNEYIWVPDKQGYEFIGSTKVDLSGYAQTDGTYAGMTVGNAASAVKAEQDGNGNTITTTYAKQADLTNLSNNLPNAYVSVAGAQTITGAKTFQSNVVFSEGTHSIDFRFREGQGAVSLKATDNPGTYYYEMAVKDGGYIIATQNTDENNMQIVRQANILDNNGNTSFPGTVNAAGYQLNGTGLFDVLFPVGAYYITESATTPASLFGGEWVRVSEKFLFGANGNGDIGSEGGEWVHTLTEAEMPTHGHKPHQYTIITSWGTNSGNLQITRTNSGKELANEFRQDNDQNRYTEYAGGNAAHNNMPPYRKVNIWRRTA